MQYLTLGVNICEIGASGFYKFTDSAVALVYKCCKRGSLFMGKECVRVNLL